MRKSNRTRKSLASAGLIALVGSALLIPSASAIREDGHFLIHAWDTDEPQFEAYAGLRGLSSGDGGSGETPEEDTSARLAEYRCGPMELAITESMLKLSESNFEAEGAPKKHAQGWSSIYSFNLETAAMDPGIGDQNAGSRMTALSSSMSAPDALSLIYGHYEDAPIFALDNGDGDCRLRNSAGPAKPGERIYYNITGDARAEGRYSRDGAEVVTQAPRVNQVERYMDGRLEFPRSSETDFYRFAQYTDSQMGIIRFPTIRDGYNDVQFLLYPDRVAIHYKYVDEEGQYHIPTEKNGPTSLSLRADGSIISLSYSSRGDELNLWDADATVENFNRVTGLSWDGSYARYGDYRGNSIPFDVTKS